MRDRVSKLTGSASYCPLFELLDNLIASIDVTISFAHVASASSEGYIRPKLHEKGMSPFYFFLTPRLEEY